MNNAFQTALLASLFALAATAASPLFALETGTSLPEISIESKGEILLEGDTVSYTAWHSSQLKGKIRTLQHIAGRTSAKEINQPFIDALKTAQLSPEHYQTTTIINVDDAIFGSSSIVSNKAESKKAEYPHSSIVIDEKSSAIKPWGLKHKGSAIIILDRQGRILFFKDGKMSETEIQETLALIKAKAQ